MKFNPLYSKIPNLIQTQDKNEAELFSKSSQELEVRANPAFFSAAKILFDSGWTNAENEDIIGATTQIENLPLPQKASYNFIFSLNVPETYLPFIDLRLFSKPTTDQNVMGASQFTYTSLQEVIIHLYNWQGMTQIIGDMTEHSASFHNSTELPSKPAPTYTIPAPGGCYAREVFFSSILFEGFSVVYELSHDGTQCKVGGVWYATADVIQNWINIWTNISVTYYFGESVTFTPDPINFPVPDDGESLLPCGGTDPDQYSTTQYPNQYWEQTQMVTFQEYMDVTGKTYAQAVAIFTQYYPHIYITPYSHGAPFKAYRRVSRDIVEKAKQTIQITKIDTDTFQFSIRGNLLLVSPAHIETDWSDPDFPTYKPQSDPISICLKAYFRGHPVNFIQTRSYYQ